MKADEPVMVNGIGQETTASYSSKSVLRISDDYYWWLISNQWDDWQVKEYSRLNNSYVFSVLCALCLHYNKHILK